MSRKYRVGILGLGHWYSGYGLARGLAESKTAELVAVAEKDAWKRNEFAGTFGIEGLASYEELIARKDIDIVHIAPPVVDIPDCVIQSAQAGKHMVMGKPMAMSVAKAEEMVKAVQKAGVVCAPFQSQAVLRSDLKAKIESGLIGDLVLIHSTNRWSIAEDWYHSGKPGWFADPACVPGGALIDEGIYAYEMIRWLAGSPCVKVECKTANLVHTDIGVEDWGMATMTFANGIIATLEASWTICSPKKTGPSPKPNANRRTEVIGTRGEIMNDSLRVPESAILAKDAPGWVFDRAAGDYPPPPPQGLVPFIIQCIEKGEQPKFGIESAFKTYRLAMAAYDAAKKGCALTGEW